LYTRTIVIVTCCDVPNYYYMFVDLTVLNMKVLFLLVI
jgi:hypothetical protein